MVAKCDEPKDSLAQNAKNTSTKMLGRRCLEEPKAHKTWRAPVHVREGSRELLNEQTVAEVELQAVAFRSAAEVVAHLETHKPNQTNQTTNQTNQANQTNQTK